MKIRWLEDYHLEVFTNYDEEIDTGDTETVTVVEGDIDEVDICGEDKKHNTIDIQFGDGSLALSVSKSVFEVVK